MTARRWGSVKVKFPAVMMLAAAIPAVVLAFRFPLALAGEHP